jgi:capsular polysaccharide biosynthesis protein
MTVHSLLAAVWRRRILASAVLVVCLAATWIALAVAPRSYTATAKITAAPSAALLSSTGTYDDLETTLAQIANSRSVLADVHSRLPDRTVDQMRGEVTGTRVKGTVLITVSVVDKSARTAAAIANTVASVLPLHDPSGGQFVFTQTDLARPPSGYSSPDVGLVLLIGCVLAVFLAVVAALVRDRVARTVETPGQLRATAGTEVLAGLPRPRDATALIDGGDTDEIANGLRSLRVELDYISSAEPTGPIVIADADPDDSLAAWLAMNLAISLAQVNHRVLVIDGDCRGGPRPESLADSDSPGLYSVLRHETRIELAIRPGPRQGVTTLPAGARPDAATAGRLIELGFHEVLASVDGLFDAVLVLAPPPPVSDDARVMAIGGSLLLAVTAGSVREARVRELIAELQATRTRLLGAVLIDAKQRARV